MSKNVRLQLSAIFRDIAQVFLAGIVLPFLIDSYDLHLVSLSLIAAILIWFESLILSA